MKCQGRALASRYLEEKGVKRELDIYYFQFSVYHDENQRILNWYKAGAESRQRARQCEGGVTFVIDMTRFKLDIKIPPTGRTFATHIDSLQPRQPASSPSWQHISKLVV